MALKRKDLLTIRELESDEIHLVLDTADSMKEIASRDIKKVPTLRGRSRLPANGSVLMSSTFPPPFLR
jgi:aspartate carbamoyltransferase catalytic subunit